MRRSWIAAAAGTALLCLTPFATDAGASPGTRAVPATVRTVVRPVTTSGHAAPGYHVTKVKDAAPIDCSSPSASVAAVNDDILECSPSAAYALACWRAAAPHHVLCLDNARKKQLTTLRTSGRIAHTTAPRHRGPLNLKLANGVYCGLRDGGAATTLRQRPNWVPTYYCTHHKAVWAPITSKDFGVHRNGHLWTVEIAGDSGRKNVHKQRVAQAFLVGTKG